MVEQNGGTDTGSNRARSPDQWFIGLMALLALYALVVVVLFFRLLAHPAAAVETELTAIRSVTENLSEHREKIESWGYQVFVLPQDAEAVGYRDYDALYFYYDDSDTVLILKDADGGMYCFYYGFDRYVTQKTRPERVRKQYSDEYVDALRTVELSVAKKNQHQAPYQENTNKPGTRNYYDMDVTINIKFFSVEDGGQLYGAGWGDYSTNYCSNNFVEHQWFGHSLHHPAEWFDERADSHIKQEYSAEELLAFYRQGLELQEKLMKLYHDAQARAA